MIEIKPWQFHSEDIWLQSSEKIILIRLPEAESINV